MPEDSFLKDITKSIKVPADITKAALEPSASQIGEGFGDLFYLVFSPITKARIKMEQQIKIFKEEIEAKISIIPAENFREPSLNIVGPALEASKYYIEDKDLRAMFANLIAASTDSRKNEIVHPSFIEIIKQLSSDEAKILSKIKGNHFPTINVISRTPEGHSPVLENFTDIAYKAECTFPGMIFSYLENMNRLGLIKLYNNGILTKHPGYEELERYPVVEEAKAIADTIGTSAFIRSHASVTSFGRNFFETCIK